MEAANCSPPDHGQRPRVLFVDDERMVLDGLASLLRRQRKTWEMDFVTGGAAALQKLAGKRADVVVSDMRMPEMDGAALLTAVREQHPDTFRIALSGHAGMEELARIAPIAHQYLSKPCEPSLLRSTVARACEISAEFRRHLILSQRRLDGLATPRPLSLYHRLLKLLGQSKVSTDGVASLIEQDARLSRRIRELLRSTSQTTRGHADMRSAIRHHGLPVVRDLVLALDALASYPTHRAPDCLSVERMRRCGLSAAHLAAILVDDEEEKHQALVAGLLHDIGWVHVAFERPSRCSQIAALVANEGMSRFEAETHVLGTRTHSIGGHLLARFGLPLPVVEAVVFYPQPDQAAQPTPRLVSALHVAVAIAHRAEAGELGLQGQVLNEAIVQEFGGPDRLATCEAAARTLLRDIAPSAAPTITD